MPWGIARYRYPCISAGTVIGALLVWGVVTNYGLVDAKFVPSPGTLLAEFQRLLSEGYGGTPFWQHVRASVLRTASGFVLGVIAGVALGIWMGMSRAINAVFWPVFTMLRPIPPIAWIPLFILFFGIGEAPKIVLIFLSAFYYVVLNSTAGVLSVPQQLLRVAENLGLSGRQQFIRVVLPASMPHVYTGIKMAAAMSWGLVVAAELIAAQEGLGHIIMDAGTFFRIPDVYIGIMVIAVIGALIELGVVSTEKKVLHWRGR